MKAVISDFDVIYTQVTTQRFLNMQALGGEVPFFIYPYNVADENSVSKEIYRLGRKLKEHSFEPLEINLYNVIIEVLEQRGMLAKVLNKEQSMSKEKLIKNLTNMLDVQTKIMPHIAKIVENRSDCSMVFITGISDVYPIIRSHAILNNLQSVIENKPVLMFFPGEYDGHRLKLFGKLTDDNYYRAFNIKSYQFEG